MKKLLFSIVTVLLMTVFMMGTVFAKAVTLVKLEATIEITANKTSVVEGDEVEFTFTIKDLKNAKDDSIAAIEGKVEYNTDFFEFVSTTFSTGGQSGEKFNVTKVGKEGEVYAKLVLKVKENASGTGDVKFTELMASDGDMDKAEGAAEASTNPISFNIAKTVTPPPTVAVTNVKIEATKTTIKVGETTILQAVVEPTTATNKKVTWSSSDDKVATIDSNGQVKGIKEGEATITATTEDGNKTATLKITIEKKDETAGDNKDNKDDGQKKDELVIEDDKNKQDEVKNDNVNGDKKDATVANTDLPKAGLSITFFVVIAAAIISAIVIYKKNQNFKDIK